MSRNETVIVIGLWLIVIVAMATCGLAPDPDIDDRAGCPPCPHECETPDES